MQTGLYTAHNIDLLTTNLSKKFICDIQQKAGDATIKKTRNYVQVMDDLLENAILVVDV